MRRDALADPSGMSVRAGSRADPLADALARERSARARAEAAALRANALRRLASALSAQPTTATVADAIVEVARSGLGAQAAALALTNDDGVVRVVRAAGVPIADGAPVREDHNPILDTLRGHATLTFGTISDFLAAYPNLASWPETGGGLRSWASIPVLGDAVAGALAVAFANERDFDAEEIEFLGTAAGLCTQALERARLHDAERAAREDADRLAHSLASLVDIGDRALASLSVDDLLERVPARLERALRCDTVRILILDEVRHVLRDGAAIGLGEELTRGITVPVGDGFAGTIASTRAPLVVEDTDTIEIVSPVLRETVRSIAGVPLLSGDRLLGVLHVGSRTPRHFDDEELAFLRLAADRIAIAIDRSREYQAQRAARERADFLGLINETVTSSMDVAEIMARVSEAAVPRLGDWCGIVVNGNDGIPLVHIAHVDPARVAWARGLQREYPYDPNANFGIPAVIRSGRTEYYPRITEQMIDLGTDDDRLREVMREARLNAAIVVPLRSPEGVLGAIQLVAAESGRTYSAADVALAEDVGARVGVALANARLYQHQREIAVTLQRSLLPTELDAPPDLDVAAYYLPAAEDADVGGDFYDVVGGSDGSWSAFLGDIAGKGVAAAALTGVARHTLRAAARHGEGPCDALRWLHDAIRSYPQDADEYCTAAFARMVPAGSGYRVQLALGGHPQPVLLRRTGETDLVGRPGTILGLVDDLRLELDEVVIEPGDALVLFTDGITDVPGPAGLDEAGLLALVAGAGRRTAAATLDEITRRVQARQAESPRRDDIALLVLVARAPASARP